MGSVVKNTGLQICVMLGRILNRPGLSVLTYHSIDSSGSYLSTSPEMFREQMQWLSALGFRCVSMRRLHDQTRLGSVPPRTVVLTFDDGLANFADKAWPVLRELSFSATAYVPTGFIGAGAAWYEDYGLPRLSCMDWATLRGVACEGADIQSHTHFHFDLAELSDDELHSELRRSKSVLEDGLSDAVEHLAYPFGSAGPRVHDAARSAGYRTAVVLGRGRWSPGVDSHAIPRDCMDRIAVRSVATARLGIEACARGTFGWYVETKARVRSFYAAPPHHEKR